MTSSKVSRLIAVMNASLGELKEQIGDRLPMEISMWSLGVKNNLMANSQ